MARSALIPMAAAAIAGCATAPPTQPAPQPDVTVYVGPKDPAYEIPERFKVPQQPPRPQPAGPEVLAFQEYGRTIADRVSTDPNFGGFVFRSEPEPHAIVMFTGDAEAQLRRYTSDPRFRAQSVDLTLAELERMKEATTEQLMGLRLECWTSDADEEHNVVTVSAPPAELDKIRAAIAEGRFKTPPKFRLVPGSCFTWR